VGRREGKTWPCHRKGKKGQDHSPFKKNPLTGNLKDAKINKCVDRNPGQILWRGGGREIWNEDEL